MQAKINCELLHEGAPRTLEAFLPEKRRGEGNHTFYGQESSGAADLPGLLSSMMPPLLQERGRSTRLLGAAHDILAAPIGNAKRMLRLLKAQ